MEQRGLGAFRALALLAHRWLSRQAMLTMQADIRAATSIAFIARAPRIVSEA
jgi:hypothetical protein